MVFIPRWEKYKDKKPSGLVEIDYSNELTIGINLISVGNEPLLNLTNNGAATKHDESGESLDLLNNNQYLVPLKTSGQHL